MTVDFNMALAECITAFGESALYVPGSGPPVPLVGIFNRYATEAKVFDSGDFRQVIGPTFALNLADFPQGLDLPVRGEIIQLGHHAYKITEPVQDNFGQLLLKLQIV